MGFVDKQKLKCEDPEQKIVQCWSGTVDEFLWVCLELVDWTIYKNSEKNLDEYATMVTDFISKCMEGCMPTKSICMFPNWKPWMNWEIHCLLKTRHAAFKSDNPDLYRKSKYDL
eukprot:g41995.t1